ncbi:MAG: hypothetical protein WBE76_05165 [Terracidiphilus sp.]
MRVTVSIDEDVDKEIKEQMRQSGDSFKATIDRLLRLGLIARGYDVDPSKPGDRSRKK